MVGTARGNGHEAHVDGGQPHGPDDSPREDRSSVYGICAGQRAGRPQCAVERITGRWRKGKKTIGSRTGSLEYRLHELVGAYLAFRCYSDRAGLFKKWYVMRYITDASMLPVNRLVETYRIHK